MATDASVTRAAVVDQVCARLTAGESVAAIFREPGIDWPHFTTFWRWLRQDEELNALVIAAQLAGCAALEDRLIDVTRESRVGEIVTHGPKGTERKVADMVDRSRLEADGIKWVLAHRYPKRYGDRVTLAGDADNPIALVDGSAVARKLLPDVATSDTPGALGDTDAD